MGDPYLLFVELQTGSTMEINVKNSQRVKTKSTIWPNYTILGHIPKGPGITLHRYLAIFIDSVFITGNGNKLISL